MWQTEMSNTLDSMALEKVKRARGNMITIEDQRVWTNGNVLRYRIMEETERRQWWRSHAVNSEVIQGWRSMFTKAAENKLNKREEDCSPVAAGYQPRRIYFDEN